MIPLLALLLAAPAPAPARTDQQRFTDCVQLSDRDPAAAEKTAVAWAGDGGGVPAAQCIGIARSAAGNWKGAADAFTAAAGLAETTHDGRAATLWSSAGNAALAGGDAARAKVALTHAIDSPVLPNQMRGEAYLDRARADVASSDLPTARADMDQAIQLVPDDPMVWLLSATLARRMSDPARAATDIAEAEKRAPTASDILFEAGNIAAAAGDTTKARAEWAKAMNAEPGSDAADKARAELIASGGLPTRSAPQGR